MARREFSTKIKAAVIKRATRDNVVYCEACGALAKKWQIDHKIADSHGGEPVIENAELICQPCYEIKNPKDTTIAAKLKRVEARHIGATRQKQQIKSPGFPARPDKPNRIDKSALPQLPRRVCGMIVE